MEALTSRPHQGAAKAAFPLLGQPRGHRLGHVLRGDPFTKWLGRPAWKLVLFPVDTAHENISAWCRLQWVARPHCHPHPGRSWEPGTRAGAMSGWGCRLTSLTCPLPEPERPQANPRPQTLLCLCPGGASLGSLCPGSALREPQVKSPPHWAWRKELVTHRVSHKLASEQLQGRRDGGSERGSPWPGATEPAPAHLATGSSNTALRPNRWPSPGTEEGGKTSQIPPQNGVSPARGWTGWSPKSLWLHQGWGKVTRH